MREGLGLLCNVAAIGIVLMHAWTRLQPAWTILRLHSMHWDHAYS